MPILYGVIYVLLLYVCVAAFFFAVPFLPFIYPLYAKGFPLVCNKPFIPKHLHVDISESGTSPEPNTAGITVYKDSLYRNLYVMAIRDVWNHV